ncbi:IS630-like element ISVa15 family transposase [Vibrio aestuarianus]|uniref:IS630-like element ISVa15 family transposase n=1 Tax=Vibrio aestuarianus TaxID=28171 RepID=UPI00237CF18F|nr:IS630-like element ISVa15 family transposase [Vibrio aestuarianus]MDE1316074.1 IS630-like element ISVa15 family transposase [Vibrio aestuarianus]
MKITLTPQQKLQLEQMHDIERDSRVCDRIKAVVLASEGWSQTMISQALRIHESTVARHLSDYVLSEKLKPENGGSQSKLSAIQTMHLIEHLTEKTYSHTHQIVAYVKETFGLDYTVSGMNKWLHHNGFSYKQPKGIPHKFDEAKQQAFIEAYEALKASCGEDESIVFIDAVHPTLSTKISHGWIRTGQDKVIETTGNRSRLNIIGALNLSDIGATIVHDYESINSESIVRFFCKLRESYSLAHKLHIILDGAGYHRSDLVKDASFVLNIKLHYLPPYSPNLNPIERLWKVMNEKSRNNVYFKRKRDFKAAIDQFFSVTLPEIAGSLTSRINDHFQVLKPASSS